MHLLINEFGRSALHRPKPKGRCIARMYYYEKSKVPWARIMLSVTGTGLLAAMVIAKENFACEATALWLLLMVLAWGDYQ